MGFSDKVTKIAIDEMDLKNKSDKSHSHSNQVGQR